MDQLIKWTTFLLVSFNVFQEILVNVKVYKVRFCQLLLCHYFTVVDSFSDTKQYVMALYRLYMVCVLQRVYMEGDRSMEAGYKYVCCPLMGTT